MDKKILDILVCPLCKGKLLLKHKEQDHSSPEAQAATKELICLFDRLAFPIKEGIPVMLEHEARVITLEEKDTL